MRRDLEVARSLARFKADQATAAAEGVALLEARLAEAEAALQVFESKVACLSG